VAHKVLLVNALSRALADRVTVADVVVGRKGLLGYLKSLSGSNIIKVVPEDKGLKVVCGAHTGKVNDTDWIGDNTPMTICEVRVSPHSIIVPNIGSGELADAISQVLPFTATDDARPILQCVNFVAGDGRLTLISADGFTLAEVRLDFEGEGQALVSRDDLLGIAAALRKAKRARVGFETSGESLDGMALIIDTELIRYKWVSVNGSFPDYEKLIPTEFNTFASFDTAEVSKAVASLVALSSEKDTAIDVTIGEGKIALANPDDRGQVELVADTAGNGYVRVNAGYLARVLRAYAGMLDFNLTNAYSPMMFSQNGNKVVVMPMLTDKANAEAKAEREARGEAEQAEPATEPEAEPVKASRKRKQAVKA